MDKIEKILRKLTAKEAEAMQLLMAQILLDYRKIPGILPLQGMRGWFRVRLGRHRVIFEVDPVSGKVEIRRVTKRDENTYKGLA